MSDDLVAKYSAKIRQRLVIASLLLIVIAQAVALKLAHDRERQLVADAREMARVMAIGEAESARLETALQRRLPRVQAVRVAPPPEPD
jgi:hypothetical protein